jgi:hypothetical protein
MFLLFYHLAARLETENESGREFPPETEDVPCMREDVWYNKIS